MSKAGRGFLLLLLLLLAALCPSVVSAAGNCDHVSTQERVVQAPTCTNSGVMGLFCTKCGERLFDYVVPADPLAHDFQSVTLRAPTCTQSGETCEECSRCGLRGSTVTVPPTGHRAGNPTQINVAGSTCTQEGGYDLAVCCEVCHEVLEKTHVAVPAAGHVPGNPVKENPVEGSCTQEGGYEQVIRCSVCGTELERTNVSAGGGGGHSMGTSYVIQEPTCLHDGLAARDCVNCGYTETWTLERTGHTWGEGVDEKQVYPTCEKIGTYDYVHYCTVCGAELKREKCTWKALGHRWGEWETVREPTQDEDGLERRVCERDSSHVQEQRLESPDRQTAKEEAKGNDPEMRRTAEEAAGEAAREAARAAAGAARGAAEAAYAAARAAAEVAAAGNVPIEPATTSPVESPTRPAPAPVPVPVPQLPSAPMAPAGIPSLPALVNYQIVKIQDADAFADDLISELSKENKTPAIDADTLKAVLKDAKDPAQKSGVENTLEALGQDYAVYHSNGQEAPSDPDLSAYHFLCGFEQFKLESGQRADQNGNPQPFEISVFLPALAELKAEEIINTMMLVYDPAGGKTALIQLGLNNLNDKGELSVSLPFAGLFTFIQK